MKLIPATVTGVLIALLAVPTAGAIQQAGSGTASAVPHALATDTGDVDTRRVEAAARALEERQRSTPGQSSSTPRVTEGPRAAAPEKAKPSRTEVDEYVALGDSWSANVILADTRGLPDSTHAPIDCAQSKVNYPKLLAAELGITSFRDATCGSATTDDFWAPQAGLPLGGTNPAQFDRLTPTTDLVTVGIGGNDAGVAAAALDCVGLMPHNGMLPALPLPAFDNPLPLLPDQLPLGGCKDKYAPQGGEDQLARRIAESEPKLVAALGEIHRRSPHARILVVDYLNAVPEHACYPLVPISEEDMQYLHATMLRLNAMVKRAAAAGGAEFVDTYTPSIGHDICQLPHVRYVEVAGPSINGPAIGVPAHPNSAGAAAQFRAVLARFQGA